MVMQPTFAGTPRTARAIGLGHRFRYWLGASGRRYLFSLIPPDGLDSLQNAVVIEACETASDAEPHPTWLGEVNARGERQGYPIGSANQRTIRTFAHFLAGSDLERRAAMLDLAGGRA